MKHQLTTLALALALASAGSVALAQTPPPAPIIANPTYAVIPMQVDINKPAADVWKRVGKYCDIGEWLQIPVGCKILVGQDGVVGAVRTVGAEVLIAVTPLSYSYTQTPKVGVPYNLYHGNLEIRPLTATTSRMYYTLIYDNSMMADDAARAKDMESRRTTFTRALGNMKILAEGGTLPPRPAPAAPAPAPK